jgi:8-oxo-dGTP pyrophosphatase MutT (NUDIX family)
MQLDVRTILLLRDSDGRILLLRRSPGKNLFPNLITGIGGSVELERAEGNNLQSAVLRELEEETKITRQMISQLRLRLSTLLSRDEAQVLLLWFTADLIQTPADLSCTEGQLYWFQAQNLPLGSMIPTARAAIPFVVSLTDADLTPYNGIFDPKTLRLITNRSPRPL